ncbi:cytochrome b/b6 domain-containing protein [Thalassotalea sediminis]|uniref:cytochrome b/b6 domain-containing protein n=1 Tax=Thalassotalea sediminis TaxID=1759089 RepID=UPI002572EFBE|nr:cytochrome b/b6 domain-containing protein [Thalassotalea sediminis]
MKQYLIWDLPIRIFHWLLVITISALWYTSEPDNNMIETHIKLGFFALGLIIFRICWGIVGTKHAIFVNFLPTPTRLKHYLKGKQQTPGHNPMGAFMVVAFLLLIGSQATSGLFINDDIFSSGPYYGVLSGELEKLMNTIHHWGFDLILIASVIHVGAVIYYRVAKGKNLVKPMFTGKKQEGEVNASDSISHSKLWTFVAVVLLVALFVYWLVVINAPVVEEFYY